MRAMKPQKDGRIMRREILLLLSQSRGKGFTVKEISDELGYTLVQVRNSLRKIKSGEWGTNPIKFTIIQVKRQRKFKHKPTQIPQKRLSEVTIPEELHHSREERLFRKLKPYIEYKRANGLV